MTTTTEQDVFAFAAPMSARTFLRRDRKVSKIVRLFAIYGNVCFYCGDAFTVGVAPTFEHISPKSAGGTFDDGNIVLACQNCNNGRGNGDFTAYCIKVSSTMNVRAREGFLHRLRILDFVMDRRANDRQSMNKRQAIKAVVYKDAMRDALVLTQDDMGLAI